MLYVLQIDTFTNKSEVVNDVNLNIFYKTQYSSQVLEFNK